ncbi:hypothetical protein LP418_12585 [Nocardioides sp. B-3]|nr:hypothetical protein LP418_12585 [Nocardioides sp. B-3]
MVRRLAVQLDRPAGRRRQPEHHVDGGGLAGAVGAEEGDDLAGLDGQVDPLDRDDECAVGGPEGLVQAGGPDGWCAHGSSLRGRTPPAPGEVS